VWLEDAMIVNHSESWKRLTASSPVPICTGENLWRRHEFADFIVHQACDILHPDLRNSGVTDMDLMDLGGWKSVGMVRRYREAVDDRLNSVIDLFNDQSGAGDVSDAH
jgi:hypothetical protein